MKKTLFAALLFALFLCASSAMAAAITIRLGHDNNVQEPGHKAFEKFKEIVESKSGGRINVLIFPGAQLGSIQDMFEQTRRGDLTMTVGHTALYTQTIPEFCVWDSFYMFDDAAHAHRVLDGKAGIEMMKPLDRFGLVGLGYMEIGFRNFSNSKRPIIKADDVRGLKIRGYSPLQIAAWEAAGASLTSLSWAEVFTSLQQNLIDGQECATSSFYNARFYEAQKYWTLTKHLYTNWLWYANKRFMDRLSADDRTMIMDAVRETIKLDRELMAAAENEVLGKLKDAGIEINELSHDERNILSDRMNGAINSMIIEKCGQGTYDMVHAELVTERK